jgi:hypothetical protein
VGLRQRAVVCRKVRLKNPPQIACTQQKGLPVEILG